MTDRDRLAEIKEKHLTLAGGKMSADPIGCPTCWLIAEVKRLRETKSLAIAHERESCAVIAQAHGNMVIAAAIRARALSNHAKDQPHD
jgi:hypothetical protein